MSATHGTPTWNGKERIIYTETKIEIQAPCQIVHRLGAEIERWPDLLPHYDSVELLYRAGNYRVARMHARRDVLPVSWTTVQLANPDAALIRFRHVRGVTRGMYVEWQLREVAGTTSVRIAHWFHPPWTPVGRLLARWIVGGFFVHNIASKTLACIKQIAEAEAGRTKSEAAG